MESSESVDRVMRLRPETIRVFIARNMLCVGCPIAPLHTVADACRAHGVELEGFLEALARAGAPPQQDSGLPSAITRSL